MKSRTLSSMLVFISTLFGPLFGQSCPPEGIAYFPLEDCTKYKLCVNGANSEVECPGGLYFNPDLNNCDLPQNVPECIEGRRNVLTQCGQTLNAYSGTIEYKLNETYEAGELCVFILRHNYSTNPGFRFVLETHGIRDIDENSITIYSLAPAYNPGFEYKMTFIGPPSLVSVLNVPGFVAVVIFKPYTNSGAGFKLRFKATGDPNPIPGYNSGSDIVYNDIIEVSERLLLRANCSGVRCADVFVATDNEKLIIDSSKQFHLMLSLDPMNAASNKTCFDIYSFEYQTIQRVSNQTTGRCWTSEVLDFDFRTRGMFIGVVTSYPGNPSTGFVFLEESRDPEQQ